MTPLRTAALVAVAAFATAAPAPAGGQLSSYVSYDIHWLPLEASYDSVYVYREGTLGRGADVAMLYAIASTGPSKHQRVRAVFAFAAGFGANFFRLKGRVHQLYVPDKVHLEEDKVIQMYAGAGPALLFRRKIYEAYFILNAGLRHVSLDAQTCFPERDDCRPSTDFNWRGTTGFAVYVAPGVGVHFGIGADSAGPQNFHFTAGVVLR